MLDTCVACCRCKFLACIFIIIANPSERKTKTSKKPDEATMKRYRNPIPATQYVYVWYNSGTAVSLLPTSI